MNDKEKLEAISKVVDISLRDPAFRELNEVVKMIFQVRKILGLD